MATDTDSVVIITGGSRGIGRAAALKIAAQGFRVVVAYASNKAAADEVVTQIETGNGKAIAVKCDVGSEADILALFKAADAFGPLKALVNNAGIVGPSIRVEDMTAERITRMMAVNVTGSFLCAREAVKRAIAAVSCSPGARSAGRTCAHAPSKYITPRKYSPSQCGSSKEPAAGQRGGQPVGNATAARRVARAWQLKLRKA